MAQVILSIQSFVSYGHVGNSAVTFPLQRLGAQVLPIHTVLFSNHTGYGQWRGHILSPESVREVFLGIKDRGILNQCSAMLSGYMGSKELGHIMIEAIKELREYRPDAVYCCDPVMGDIGRGFFVKDGIPEFFRDEMIKHANIITPNHFELEYLSDSKFNTVEGAVQAARKVMEKGPDVVVITSLLLNDTHDTNISILVVNRHSVYIATTPYIPIVLNGTGDLTAALFTYFYLKFSKSLAEALEATISRVYAIIDETYHAGSRELVLVQAQEALSNPKHIFKAKKIRL